MSAGPDVVRTRAELPAGAPEALLVLDPLEAFLDAAGLGAGPVEATPLGDGHSNVTYLLRRGGDRFVLRRPPRGPLAPSTHDVLREARLLRALRPLGARVPEVLASCDDAAAIGAPFYVMGFVDGVILGTQAPPEADRPAFGDELVAALAELHAIDAGDPALADFVRRGGYLERQLNRFTGLLEVNATRPLPDLERVGAWLAANRPATARTTVVHGDYRLGNTMFSRAAPPRLVAVLDWEMAALGDPLADLGYLTATWATPGDVPNVIGELTPVTRLPGFAGPDQLARRYAERTGCSLDALAWYQALALWKTAILLEGSYRRYLAGSTSDAYFARLEDGVPGLARAALALTA